MTRITDELLDNDLDMMWDDWAVAVTYQQASAVTVNLNTGVATPTATSHSVTGIVSEPGNVGSNNPYKQYPEAYAKYERLIHLRVSDIAFEPQKADRVTLDSVDWVVDYVGKDGSGRKWLLGLGRAK